MTDRATSPAYKALSPSARKVLALIDSEVACCDGAAVISYSDIKRRCDVTHGTAGYTLRQVRTLGFVSVERVAARSRYVNTFRLSSQWQSIGTDEAHRLAVRARLSQSRPPLRMPKPRTPKQPPSLANITLGDLR